MAESPEAKRERQLRQAAHARAALTKKRDAYNNDHQTIRVSMRKRLLKKLDVEARRREINRTDLVREIVEEYVSKLPDRKRGGEGW